MKLTLIKVSGPDHPGITARLMEALEKHSTPLLDMGQSITHGLLSLSFLIEHDSNSDVLKDLLFSAKEMGMVLDYQEVQDAPSNKLMNSYIISCISAENITAGFMKELAGLLASHKINIKRIDNLNSKNFKTIDLMIDVKSNLTEIDQVKQDLLSLSHTYSLDLALIKNNVWRRNKRLIVFDMDSTLIQSEVIVEMAKVHGVGEQVHEITEKAMNGELNFDQSLTERVSLLKGLSEDALNQIKTKIKLTEGVESFLSTVQKLGYKTAIISGGFLHFANYFQEKLNIDYVFANDLEIKDGALTGKVKGDIVNAARKAELLTKLAEQESINIEQVVAIGDGANDLPMLATAGLGIAFHAKDIVKKEASQHMSYGSMESILYFLGINPEV